LNEIVVILCLVIYLIALASIIYWIVVNRKFWQIAIPALIWVLEAVVLFVVATMYFYTGLDIDRQFLNIISGAILIQAGIAIIWHFCIGDSTK
jgi:hypothetical protein